MGPPLLIAQVALQAISQLMEADEWETVKEYLRRGDRQGASNAVNRALTEIKSAKIATIDKQTRADVIFQVLDLAAEDERPLLSTVIGIRSAEQVGKNLTRATQDLTQVTQAAGESLARATNNLTQVTQAAGESLARATNNLTQVTQAAGESLARATNNLTQVTQTIGNKLLTATRVLVAASVALFLATVALVIVTALT